jgi:hypothetical protein
MKKQKTADQPDDRTNRLRNRLLKQIELHKSKGCDPVYVWRFNSTLRSINPDDRSQFWEFKDRHLGSTMREHPIWSKYPLVGNILNTIEARKFNEEKGKKYVYVFLFEYEKQLYHKPRKRNSYPYAAFRTDEYFYKTILPVLGISKITLQKYLAELCRIGVLELREKEGKRHIPIYSIGYFTTHGKGIKLNPHLIIKTMDMLDKFAPEFSKNKS